MAAATGDGLWAVVPVKAFGETKRRLAAALPDAQRAELARLMFDDVLDALLKTRGLAGVLVVTGDPEVARLALEAGAQVLHEHQGTGTAGAVALAARHLAAEGRAGMLVVPADVPSITARDIEALLRVHVAAVPAVTLVAARDGGTNGLVCSPPDAVPPCFGTDSFRRHMAAARERGIVPAVVALATLGLDIDCPEDLERFRASPLATHSRAWAAVQRLPVAVSQPGSGS